MSTLYVENVPDNLYETLREQAKRNRRSIAGEVISLIEQYVVSSRELEARKAAVERLVRLQAEPSPGVGPFRSTEEMVREDRGR